MKIIERKRLRKILLKEFCQGECKPCYYYDNEKRKCYIDLSIKKVVKYVENFIWHRRRMLNESKR